MVEFINSVHPGWLILVWLFCAVTSYRLSLTHINPGNNAKIIYAVFGMFLWLGIGSFMLSYSPANNRVTITVYETVVMWGKVMVGLYLYLSLPLLLSSIRQIAKTKLWQWLIA